MNEFHRKIDWNLDEPTPTFDLETSLMDKPLLFFLDYETTSLDTDSTYVLETAAALYDLNRQAVVWTYNNLSLPLSDEDLGSRDARELSSVRLASLQQVVRDMHQESGLLDDLRNMTGHNSMLSIDKDLSEGIGQFNDSGERDVYLAGSGVSEFDRPIMKRLMPMTHSAIGYRSIDMGIVRRFIYLAGLQLPDIPAFGTPAHRAPADVIQSISQFQWISSRIDLVSLASDDGIDESEWETIDVEDGVTFGDVDDMVHPPSA